MKSLNARMSEHRAKRLNGEEGFTLIEVMIVVVIIGILAAIAIPVFNGQQAAAIDATVKSDVKNTAINATDTLAKNPSTPSMAAAMGVTDGSPVLNDAAKPTNIAITNKSTTITITGDWSNYRVVGVNKDVGSCWQQDAATGLFTDCTPSGNDSKCVIDGSSAYMEASDIYYMFHSHPEWGDVSTKAAFLEQWKANTMFDANACVGDAEKFYDEKPEDTPTGGGNTGGGGNPQPPLTSIVMQQTQAQSTLMTSCFQEHQNDTNGAPGGEGGYDSEGNPITVGNSWVTWCADNYENSSIIGITQGQQPSYPDGKIMGFSSTNNFTAYPKNAPEGYTVQPFTACLDYQITDQAEISGGLQAKGTYCNGQLFARS